MLHPAGLRGEGSSLLQNVGESPPSYPRFSAAQFACPGDVGGVSAEDCGRQNGRKQGKPWSDEVCRSDEAS